MGTILQQYCRYGTMQSSGISDDCNTSAMSCTGPKVSLVFSSSQWLVQLFDLLLQPLKHHKPSHGMIDNHISTLAYT